jgi:ubiquinone/menaquinone biosynthesis C-methylase UbiE
METTAHYTISCKKAFWKKVFAHEMAYLASRLERCRNILSVGCGPGNIENGLAARGFSVTGLDVSWKMLRKVPKRVRCVAGRGEDMPFLNGVFDAVIYVASLQFIENYPRALEKTALVLRPGGRIIVMLLNPASDFFKGKLDDPNSYFHRIKHRDLKRIEKTIARNFNIRTEYFLGVRGGTLLKSAAATEAALYVITGTIDAS